MKTRIFLTVAVATLCVSACYDDSEIRGRLDTLEKTTKPIPDEITGLQTSTASLQLAVTSLEDTDKAIRDEITALENKLNTSTGLLSSQIDAIKEDIATLKTVDTRLQNQINGLREDIGAYLENELNKFLEKAKKQFATSAEIKVVADELSALKSQVSDMSTTLNQKIDSSIASLRTWVTDVLKDYYSSQQIDSMGTVLIGRLDSLGTKLDSLSGNVSSLMGRIQSITFVPKCADGFATAWYGMDEGTLMAMTDTLDFKIRPGDIAASLAANPSCISVEAVSTRMRSSNGSTALTVCGVESDGDVLSVAFLGSGLDKALFAGTAGASVCIVISDGNINMASDFIKLVPELSGSFVPVSGVELNNSSVSIKLGETLTLEATVLPLNASVKTVSWSSDNQDVASVTSYGKITPIGAGTCTVKAASGRFSASCSVTVTAE